MDECLPLLPVVLGIPGFTPSSAKFAWGEHFRLLGIVANRQSLTIFIDNKLVWGMYGSSVIVVFLTDTCAC
jgi:hypothetical protein